MNRVIVELNGLLEPNLRVFASLRAKPTRAEPTAALIREVLDQLGSPS